MIDEPLWPVLRPSDLSDDARAVIRLLRARRLGGDPFGSPGRFRAAVSEIEAAGLRLPSDDHHIDVVSVAGEYTVAHGQGPLLAQVGVVAVGRAGNPDFRAATRLATLVGADLELRGSRGAWTTWRLSTTHPTATDFEHSPSRTADLWLAGMVVLDIGDGITDYVGTLTSALLYPFGLDLLDVEDGDTRPGTCTRAGCGRGEHPLAAFMPPERSAVSALAPSVVVVRTQTLPGA